jgi:hypothetical protein
MGLHTDLTAQDVIALRCFQQLAASSAGYLRRGVRGWALREDIERITRVQLPERLPKLHHRGFLDREDVRAPSLSRPIWIYRITAAGTQLVGARAGRDWVPVAPLGDVRGADQAIYIPPRSWLALLALREAVLDPQSGLLDGEPGWRTMIQLTERLRFEEDDYEQRPSQEWWGDPDAWMAGGEWRRVGWLGEFENMEEILGSSWDPLRGGCLTGQRMMRGAGSFPQTFYGLSERAWPSSGPGPHRGADGRFSSTVSQMSVQWPCGSIGWTQQAVKLAGES